MLPTHALGGMVLGLAVAAITPEFAGVALVAGLFGGILPDLDLYAGHRRTLHFPVYYSIFALGAVVLVLLVPSTATVGLTLVLLGAATHSVTDVFGGGLELRPWEGTSDRAVYDHYRSQWIAPRRWVGYDGSPRDLLLSLTLAVPLLISVDGVFQTAVVLSLTVAVLYTAVRRYLPTIAEVLIGSILPLVPGHLHDRVPDRYLQSHSR